MALDHVLRYSLYAKAVNEDKKELSRLENSWVYPCPQDMCFILTENQYEMRSVLCF